MGGSVESRKLEEIRHVAVRAIRGAIQVDADEREAILEATAELIAAVAVPLMCATEIPVPGAMPRVVRLMAHVETDWTRSQIQHVYLRGAVALRLDIAQ
jgi:chorismate mutase